MKEGGGRQWPQGTWNQKLEGLVSLPRPSSPPPSLYTLPAPPSALRKEKNYDTVYLPQSSLNPHTVLEKEKGDGETLAEDSESLSTGNEFCKFQSFHEEMVGFWVNSDKN